MILTVHLLLYILAFVCFLAATGNAWSRYNLVALGLALWVLTLIV
jgi:hypothetical protein